MNKKPDLMDGILFYQSQAEEKNLPSQIYDYPEHVLSTLIMFQKLWMLPEHTVPKKELRGRFSQYITELNELNEIAGSRINEALTRAYKKYDDMTKRFIVSHPAAIKKLLIDVVAEMNREQRKLVQQKEVASLASPVQIKNTIKELKSMFEEEEE